MAGQTLSEIRALLAGRGLSPRHRFGQNFLIDLNLMRKLVHAAALTADDVVLEVGPGTGSLTELLLEAGPRVVAVEIDRGLAGILTDRFADRPRFTLLNCDVLAGKNEIAPNLIAALEDARARSENSSGSAAALKLVANLPYQVATPLLLELLCRTPRFALLAFTIQKEVADRLTAETGTADYGPISVIVRIASTVELLADVAPAAFWPRPKVESAMMIMRPIRNPPIDDLIGFAALVRSAFLHRRQMLRRIVARWDNATAAITALEESGIDSAARPQDICPDAWRRWHQSLRAAERT